MKVYLSGRMSGLKPDAWKWRFASWQILLGMDGHKVVNPARIWVARWAWLYKAMEMLVGRKTAYRIVLWYDIQLLRRCEAIFMVADDWRQSRGARLERLKARQWGIKEIE